MTNADKKLLIINGATRGLGYSLTEMISKRKNFDIICVVRNTNELGLLKKIENSIELLQCDYSKSKEVKKIGRKLEKYSRRNYSSLFFINNVGTINPIGLISCLSSKEIITSIQINITSNLIILNSIIKYFESHVSKLFILNISSGISNNPVPGLGMYGIGKAYIDYITAVFRKEMINENIVVSSFYPGGMDTKMQSDMQNSLKYNSSLINFDYYKWMGQVCFQSI